LVIICSAVIDRARFLSLFYSSPDETVERPEKIQGIASERTKSDYHRWIHGRITEIQDTTVTIEVDKEVQLRIEKSAVAIDNTQTIEAK